MTKPKGLLDLPNEILRDHILSQIEQDELFWNVGMVCKRLLLIVFDINKCIVVTKREVFKRRSWQRCQSQTRPSYLMKFHKDAFNEQEEFSLQAELQTIFRLKEVSQPITSFSNVHMQPYYLQTKWEELPSDELLKGVAVLYKAGFTPMKVLADILINSHRRSKKYS